MGCPVALLMAPVQPRMSCYNRPRRKSSTEWLCTLTGKAEEGGGSCRYLWLCAPRSWPPQWQWRCRCPSLRTSWLSRVDSWGCQPASWSLRCATCRSSEGELALSWLLLLSWTQIDPALKLPMCWGPDACLCCAGCLGGWRGRLASVWQP